MDALGGGYGVHDRKDGTYAHILTTYYVRVNAHVHLLIHFCYYIYLYLRVRIHFFMHLHCSFLYFLTGKQGSAFWISFPYRPDLMVDNNISTLYEKEVQPPTGHTVIYSSIHQSIYPSMYLSIRSVSQSVSHYLFIYVFYFILI